MFNLLYIGIGVGLDYIIKNPNRLAKIIIDVLAWGF